MQQLPLNLNEKERLDKLKSYKVLDTFSEKEYDDIVNLASIICETPIALISLIDETRQWFKAHHGLDEPETPRENAFCHYTIMQDEVMEINNSLEDPRFVKNPLVTGHPKIRFYAGAPLKTADGFNLGSLCVIDTVPRTLTFIQKKALEILANSVIIQLELKKKNEELLIERSKKNSALDSLETSEKKYREIIEKAGDIFYTSDPLGNFTYVNKSVEATLGYNTAELIGRHFSTIIVPAWQDKVNAFYQEQFIQKTKETILEFPVVNKGGDVIWVEQVVVLLEENDKRVGFQCVARNIDKRKALESQLQETNNFQKVILDGTDYAIIGLDVKGVATVFNKGAEKMLGYAADEVIGKAAAALFHDADELARKAKTLTESYGYVVSEFESLVLKSRSGIPDTNEWVFVNKAGFRFPVLLSVTTLFDADKKVIGHLKIARDISQEKKDAEEIRKNTAFFKAINAASPLGMVVTDQNGKCIYINQSLTSILGYTITDWEGFGWRHAIYKEDKAKVLAEWFAATSIQSKFKSTHRFEKKDGTLIWASVMAAPMNDGNRLLGYVATIIDITENKSAEEALMLAKQIAEDGKRMQEQFLANMSHEIRTPMNGVIGMTDLLMDTHLSNNQLEYVETIKESSNNLLVIINDILDLSKINDGKIVFEEKELDLQDSIRHIVNTLNHRAEENGIYLRSFIDSRVNTHVVGDSVRLNQVLLNLVSNAIKFTHQGSVTISVNLDKETEEGMDLSFIIEDTGIGISKDKLEAVFESFIQASSSTTTLYGGTGLGLTIAKQLIEAQGGTISLESELGKGSLFTVKMHFLKSRIHTREKQQEAKPNVYHDLTGLTILLAEDNKINQRVALLTISKWGASVEIADNGKIALQMLKEKNYDLILMDLQMPEMNGLEATNLIRNLEQPKCSVPIMAMTASALRGEREKCIEMGMDDYISKPFNPYLLNERIKFLTSVSLAVDCNGSSLKHSDDKISVVNLTYLDEISGGDPAFKNEIIEMFCSMTPGILEQIQEDFKKADWDAVKKAIHKLKSSISMIGISVLIKEMEKMEVSDNREELVITKEFIDFLISTCNQAFNELKA